MVEGGWPAAGSNTPQTLDDVTTSAAKPAPLCLDERHVPALPKAQDCPPIAGPKRRSTTAVPVAPLGLGGNRRQTRAGLSGPGTGDGLR